MKKTIYIITFLIFFSGSFFYFVGGKNIQKKQPSLSQGGVGSQTEVDTGPKTEPCPLNGALYSKKQKKTWEARRPLGIMVENSLDARPQSGISNADVVFEAVAEGGVTRFLGVYYCQDAKTVGPVRSARVYFLDLIGGFGEYPLYAHVGGANTSGPANALGQIDEMGWGVYNDLNQFAIGFPVFWRDYERLPSVATEHTMYSNTDKLWQVGVKRGLSNKDEQGVLWSKGFVSWLFKKDAAAQKRGKIKKISYGFWESYKTYNVRWEYDSTTNQYLRYNGGKKHLDKNTSQQLSVSNVVVALMKESVANDGYDQGQHLLYGTEGFGDMYLFQDGQVIKGTWNKVDRFSQIVFKDESGKEVSFNPGLIWISIVPTGNKINFNSTN